MWPRKGDIVFNAYEPKKKVAIFPPEDRSKDLSQIDRSKMANNAKQWQDIVQNSNELAKKIQAKLRDGFLKLNSVGYETEGIFQNGQLDVSGTCKAAVDKGATHVVGGYITPTKAGKDVKYKVNLNVFKIEKDASGRWGLGQDLHSLSLGSISAQSID